MVTELRYTSLCCNASATYPGFPDSDVCSDCKEHSGFKMEGREEE